MAYAAATHWYARPGATSNRKPDPAEATRDIPGPPPPRRVEGAVEGEKAKILARTGGVTEIQRIARYNWSGNAQLWWRDAKPGDKLTLALSVPKAGRHKLIANFTKAVDYAIVQFHLDGKKLGEPIDFYNHGVVTTGPVVLGTLELAEGPHKLTAEIVGANPKALPRHMLGLDYLKLERAH